jgi:hypothetical protein
MLRKKLLNPFLFLMGICVLTHPAFADNRGELEAGDVRVAWVAFNSPFLKPDIARAAGLTREDGLAYINVSVYRADRTLPAQLDGVVTNLLGQKETLVFKAIREQNAVYYLAPFHFNSEEIQRLDVQVRPEGTEHPITFKGRLKLWKEGT